jgi:hypothetical protein
MSGELLNVVCILLGCLFGGLALVVVVSTMADMNDPDDYEDHRHE